VELCIADAVNPGNNGDLLKGEPPMSPHVCPWWGGYFIDNPLRRWLHNPKRILAPYVVPGMTVMDFGCGMGMFAIAMAEKVGPEGRVIAVDLQAKMLEVLMQRARKAGVAERIRPHCCAADSIGLDEQVDFVLAFYSAHEVPDVRRLIGEVYGCLRAGGKFLVVEPVGHVTAQEFEAMLSLADEIGLQEQERPRIRFSRAAVLLKTVAQ
jgi:SAM-dependent methyltransferase